MRQDRQPYRHIVVDGRPREMGRLIGEAAKSEIRGYAEVVLERINQTVTVSRDKALEVARHSHQYAQQYCPEAIEELAGIAEVTGVSIDDLMLFQVRNQFHPEGTQGCTALACTGDATHGQSIIAQNWDNDPELDPFTVVLTRRPHNRPAFMCLTQVWLAAYIGLNEAGFAMCLNTLPAPSREIGVPFYVALRAAYAATSLAPLLEEIHGAYRVIPANILLATPSGPVDMEITIDDVHIIQDQSGIVVHTNHCLHPQLTHIADTFGDLIQSRHRKQRIEALLQNADRPITTRTVQGLLSDHENHPFSICRHPNADPATGYWQSVFSVIMEPESARMHVCRGNPCANVYSEYCLN